MSRGPLLAALCTIATMPAWAADLVIYDDVLQNSFQDYSYGGGSDFASTAQAHASTTSIAFTGNNYNAVSFFHVGAYDTAAYPVLHFWVHGGASGGQQLYLFLQNNNLSVAQGELDSYIAGGAIVAGTWKEVTVPLTTGAINYNGPFDRIDVQSDSGGGQPTLYIDDVSLQQGVVDLVFKNGFEGDTLPPPGCGMTDEHDITAAGMLSDRFSWCDSAGQPRKAVLAHNDGVVGPGGSRGGELRRFVYQVGAATRTVNASSSGASGFGYAVSHPNSENFCTPGHGDTSSLGHFFSGTWTRVFEGRHHAIFRFQQTYPRYCTTGAPAAQYNLPVTIDWMFSSGRDHPLWAITWDMQGPDAMNPIAPVNRLEDDTRAPYGELLFDGSASEAAHSTIAGVGWGDRYKFVSAGNPVTYNSAWTWNTPNTVPYVKLWTTAVDATMGTVQTQTIVQQDAGGYFGTNRWSTTYLNGNACLAGYDGPSAHSMPCSYNWPYQSINYSFGEAIGGNNADSTNNTRLAWGTNFGFLGQSAYHIHGSMYWGGPLPDATASGWPKKSYSVYVVLGTHTSDPVDAQVAQVETVQTLALTINGGIGSVATSGPAGVNRSDSVTYAPAGWNHVYGALAFNASASNALDANIAVGAGRTLKHPLLVLRNYAGGYPSSVKLNGTTLAIDVDYFPSLRAGASELWFTLNRDLGGANNRVEIVP